MCGTYGGGEVHNSLWPWGPVYSLTFTCMKSEYPGHPRGGGGVARVVDGQYSLINYS